MKILVCGSTDSSFNSVRPEAEIYIGLARRGHQLTVFTHGDSEYARHYRDAGICVVDAHPLKRFDWSYLRRLRAELKQGYDILYATNSKVIRHAVLASIGVPVVLVTYRGTTGGLYWHDPSAYLSHLSPRVNGIVGVSEAVTADVRRQLWRHRDKVVTIHKGHSLDWYSAPVADLTTLGVPAGSFAVACVANTRPSKGVHVLLEASNGLAANPDIHLVLVGKGMDQQPYLGLAQRSAMRERIHILGYRFDAPQIIGACQVLVQPSISGEGLPRTVMESMGYGTPVVATQVGGAKEAITDGVEGFIIPPGSAAAIVERVLQLAADPILADAMACASRVRIAGPLSAEATVLAYETYFSRLRH